MGHSEDRETAKTLLGRASARARRMLGRFRKSEDGATAIEFAILALPFLVLLFAILEIAVVFFLTAALHHGTAQAGRLVRVGSLQAEGDQASQLLKFREAICEEMAQIQGCMDRLRVDIVKGTTFGGVTLPQRDLDMFASLDEDDDPEPTDPPASEFDCSGPREVVMLRTEFYHSLVLPRKLTFLGNDPKGYNRRILRSTTAFRNEPFPTAGRTVSCGGTP